ncbi:MAG: SPFH domain-containing protein, partial [Pseudomonadota bacterium]
FVENVSLPEAVEQAMDKRTSMGVIGDLGKYAQFQAAESMRAAAENPGAGGNGMGAGLGMGMGMAMANAMGGGFTSPWGQAPQQPQQPAAPAPVAAAPPPPPPPAVEVVYHIAENGQTTGPFSLARLGRMVGEGTFSRETLVWSAGMQGWTAAGEVDALARLFTVAPPPPPPPT